LDFQEMATFCELLLDVNDDDDLRKVPSLNIDMMASVSSDSSGCSSPVTDSSVIGNSGSDSDTASVVSSIANSHHCTSVSSVDDSLEVASAFVPPMKRLKLLHDQQHAAAFAVACSITTTTSNCLCRVDSCELEAQTRSLFCTQHAKGRRCQSDGCMKCAQGSTCFCIKHGGGRRCTFPGCGKGARDKQFCALHGGGKRCIVPSCSKSAVGGSTVCTGHGGGKRCQIAGCNKSAQSSTQKCVRHGGGRLCVVGQCTKVARGKTDYCAGHGRQVVVDHHMPLLSFPDMADMTDCPESPASDY
jgi:hypothetical protein